MDFLKVGHQDRHMNGFTRESMSLIRVTRTWKLLSGSTTEENASSSSMVDCLYILREG